MSDVSSNDRPGLCVFTFDDGRCCAMPRANNGLNFCYFHEQRERRRLNAQSVGIHITQLLNSGVQTACDLNAAFTMLFRGAALGLIPAESLGSYTRLGRLLLESHLLAKEEVLSAYETDWPAMVQCSSIFNRPVGSKSAEASDSTEKSPVHLDMPAAPKLLKPKPESHEEQEPETNEAEAEVESSDEADASESSTESQPQQTLQLEESPLTARELNKLLTEIYGPTRRSRRPRRR